MKNLKIQTLLKFGFNTLYPSITKQIDAEILLALVLDVNRIYIHTWPEKIIEEKYFQKYQHVLKLRKKGIPIAYILGKKEFWSLELSVTKEVLIPRPETELLVELALEKIPKNSNQNILDLGTGSGAIALAIAKERPKATIFAVDNSKKALNVAIQNCNKFGFSNINFFLGNWFSPFSEHKFNYILANPPYIDPNDPHLINEDIKHEPMSALISNENGLADLKIIINESKNYLCKDGWIFLEHGYNQAAILRQYIQKNNYFNVTTLKDYNSLDRITFAKS